MPEILKKNIIPDNKKRVLSVLHQQLDRTRFFRYSLKIRSASYSSTTSIVLEFYQHDIAVWMASIITSSCRKKGRMCAQEFSEYLEELHLFVQNIAQQQVGQTAGT